MACCGGEFVTRSIPARSPAPPPEGALHGGHCRGVPGTDWVVEDFRDAEHALHGGHCRSVPGIQWLVEGVGVFEHALHGGLWFLATTWHGQIGPGLSRPHPDPLHHRKSSHALPTSNVRIQIVLAHVKRLGTGVVASGLDFAQLLPDMRALFHTNKVDPFRTPA